MKKCSALSVIFFFATASLLHAENWPGYNKGGQGINSSSVSIGNTPVLDWVYTLDPLNRQDGSSTYRGSFRSKNLAIRDGVVAVLVPDSGNQHFGYLRYTDGVLLRSFATHLDDTTKAEFNPSGVEGRDLRNGQFRVYWHANGNVYGKSGGDDGSAGAWSASDGTLIRSKIYNNVYNQSAYFVMADNCSWAFVSPGGHTGFPLRWNTVYQVPITSSALSDRTVGLNSSVQGSFFNWSGPFLVDGSKFYSLGATHHPEMGESDTYAGSNKDDWLGAQVRAYTMKGQDPDNADHQHFMKAATPDWLWEEVDAFVGNDGDLSSSPKAWCLGTNEIYLVTQGGVSHTDTDADVDFTQPLVLHGLSRTDGTEWNMNLGITANGCTMSEYYSYSGSYSTFHPQISYLDVTEGGDEYVAVMLPENIRSSAWLDPNFNPFNSNASLNTRLAVVNVTAKTELWNYEYPHNGTTPVWNYACSSNTKMLIAGDSVYVCYVKTSTALSNYIDKNNSYPLSLYVDRFNLLTGTKTSFTYPLGVNANTIQLDDLAAVDGRLIALVTYREWYEGSAETGGAQLVACIYDPTQSTPQPPQRLRINRTGE